MMVCYEGTVIQLRYIFWNGWLLSSKRPEIILLEGQIIRSPTDQDQYYIKILICSAIVGGES